MTDEEYKRKMIKDVLKFSKDTIAEEELIEFMSSPIYQEKDYLTESCILVKGGVITLREWLNLKNVKAEDLRLYLNKEEYNFFHLPTQEEVLEAFTIMESNIPLTKEEEEEDRIYREKVKRIKELGKIEDEMRGRN